MRRKEFLYLEIGKEINQEIINSLSQNSGCVITCSDDGISTGILQGKTYTLKEPRMTLDEQEQLIEMFYTCLKTHEWDDVAEFADKIIQKQLGLRTVLPKEALDERVL